jgi:hypothetical protein
VGAVDEGLGQVELAAVTKIFRQPPEHLLEDLALHPRLEAAMAGRRRRIATREVRPRRAGAKYPHDAVDDVTRISPGSATLRRDPFPFTSREAALDRIPLLVGEVHPHL